jgi:hypothetical protein
VGVIAAEYPGAHDASFKVAHFKAKFMLQRGGKSVWARPSAQGQADHDFSRIVACSSQACSGLPSNFSRESPVGAFRWAIA